MRIGPQYKICRRVGDKIFPKCQTTKFAIASGDQRGKRRKKESEFGAQLLQKQKARYTYGVSEKQFSNYVKKARKTTAGTTTAGNIFKFLETRLDNTVFRLGIASTRSFARQMVSHGHILVNGKRLNIPSYDVRKGDKISVRPQSQSKNLFKNDEEKASEKGHPESIPSWLIFDEKKKSGEVKNMPQFGENESNLDFSAIIEFYSRV